MTYDSGSDESQIRALIGAHFDALKWSPGSNTDWKTFSTDFLSMAQLFPAARPVQAKSLNEFIERMNSVAQGSLQDFEERTLGMTIHPIVLQHTRRFGGQSQEGLDGTAGLAACPQLKYLSHKN